MNKVYFQKPWTPDEYLGYVGVDGRVFVARLGPDQYVGRVSLEDGKVFFHRAGPDELLGKIALDTGKIYRYRFLDFDEYLGRVDKEGRLFAHVALAPDDQIGKMVGMMSFAHAGGAFLLLVWPHWENLQAEKRAKHGGAPTTKPPVPTKPLTPTTPPTRPPTTPPTPTTKPLAPKKAE